MHPSYSFRAKLWLYQGEGAWVFVTLPKKFTSEIAGFAPAMGRGFGAVRVTVQCNGASWQTSIFPDKKSGAYLLPLKKAMRQKAGIAVDDTAEFTLELTDL